MCICIGTTRTSLSSTMRATTCFFSWAIWRVTRRCAGCEWHARFESSKCRPCASPATTMGSTRSSSEPKSLRARTGCATRFAAARAGDAGASTVRSATLRCSATARRRVAPAGVPLNIVAGRPHSIGGRRLACIRYLEQAYGVDSMEASSAALKSLVDECDDAPLVFLAHNGPSGLGDRASSIWGCDFRKKEEDWGDRDLEEAVATRAPKRPQSPRNGRRPHAPQNEIRTPAPRPSRKRRSTLRERSRGAEAPKGERIEGAASREVEGDEHGSDGTRRVGLEHRC